MKTKLLLLCLVLASVVTRAQAQTQTLEVWGHDITMTADGTTVTHLTISERDVVDYTGFSLTIVVPKGIHVAQVRNGREYVDDISLNADRATTTHEIACNMPQDNIIKVIASSTKNSNFYPDDIDGNPVTDIFTIGLVADPTMVNGTYEVSIIDCKFKQSKASIPASQPQAPITMKMTVTGGVDGVQVGCTLGADGVGTLILPFDAPLPQSVTAYTCSALDGTTLLLDPVSTITAGTPVIVTGTPGTYTFTGQPTCTETTYTTGLLTGVLEDTPISSGYVLQKQDAATATAFYRVDAARPVTVPAYKCYLNTTATAAVMRLADWVTAVKPIDADAAGKDRVYGIDGRRVNVPTAPGAYIKNKKKYIKTTK